jgi:3-methyladenine DNA glycosylase AlkC
MAALKHQVDAALGRRLAAEVVAAWPAFPRRRFMSGLAAALEPLELLARIGELADRLSRALPAEFPAASAVLWRCLDSPSFTGWMTVACGTAVSVRGIDDPELALPLLAGLTPRWSSEWAIRPFIERHPALTYDHLRRWIADDDEHVRRLVSEGTRPRLPWAPQLRSLVADPTPNLPLLDALAGDSSPYVRRSVANHLNDIAKDHPALALDLARRWLSRDGAGWTARHGIRTLIKRGDAQALELAGATIDADVRLVELTVERDQVPVGETALFTVTLELAAGSPRAADVVVDYRVHYVGARKVKAPRVFKLAHRRLEPGRPVTLTREHAFDHVSIRRIHPGPHAIDIQVNGRVLGTAAVEITPADT